MIVKVEEGEYECSCKLRVHQHWVGLLIELHRNMLRLKALHTMSAVVWGVMEVLLFIVDLSHLNALLLLVVYLTAASRSWPSSPA